VGGSGDSGGSGSGGSGGGGSGGGGTQGGSGSGRGEAVARPALDTRPALDVVIEGAAVYDGSGRAPFHADVGVSGTRIAAIGDLSGAGAGRRVPAHGLALCPGFVDVHSHADMTIVRPDHSALLEPLVRQGITTFVGGNCGAGMAPVPDGPNREHLFAFWDFFLGAPQDGNVRWKTFGGMLDTLSSQGVLLNVAMLAPYNIIRMGIAGGRAHPTSDERALMRRTLADALDAGAIGMSAGLQYFPGLLSETGEIVEMARVVHGRHGVVAAHLRSYNSDTLSLAMDELLEIGRLAEVPVQASHLFVIPNLPGPLNRLAATALRAASAFHRRWPFRAPIGGMLSTHLDHALRSAAAAAQPIGFDAMPTSAGFTHLLAFFPPWSVQGGVRASLAVLADPEGRRRVRRSIEDGDAEWPHRDGDSWSMNLFKVMGWGGLHLMSLGSGRNPHRLGRSLADLAGEAGRDPFDFMCDLLVEEQGRILAFITPTYPGDGLAEQSLEPVLADPNVSIATDSILLGFGLPSHLFYDCFPRFLGRYARDLGLLSMSEAIRKCTALPAEQAGLRDRGRVREGWFADLVLFDPGRLASRSTPEAPRRFPDGIHTVFVNGSVVVDPDGFHPSPRAGVVIRRGG